MFLTSFPLTFFDAMSYFSKRELRLRTKYRTHRPGEAGSQRRNHSNDTREVGIPLTLLIFLNCLHRLCSIYGLFNVRIIKINNRFNGPCQEK